MTKNEAVELILSGRWKEWNTYRQLNKKWAPDFSNFQFPECNLAGVNLENADLRGADLSKVKLFNFYSAKITGAKYNIRTKWAQGFKPSDWGAILISEGTQMSTPNVFLSYAWADKFLIRAVDQWLRNKGLNTRIDERDFFAGSRIRDEILRVMQTCDAVVIFHSSFSKDKPWTEFERELAGDLEIEAKKSGKNPPRIIYVVIGSLDLPNITERNRIAIITEGKRFPVVCDEIYRSILGLSRDPDTVDLKEWENYEF